MDKFQTISDSFDLQIEKLSAKIAQYQCAKKIGQDLTNQLSENFKSVSVAYFLHDTNIELDYSVDDCCFTVLVKLNDTIDNIFPIELDLYRDLNAYEREVESVEHLVETIKIIFYEK